MSGDAPDSESDRWVAGRRRTTAEFDALYAEGTPPWDIGQPQPALQAVAEAGEVRGRVLDSGCGTLSFCQYTVTGTLINPNEITGTYATQDNCSTTQSGSFDMTLQSRLIPTPTIPIATPTPTPTP